MGGGNFNYTYKDGVQTWPNGNRQSPVDINTCHAHSDIALKPISIDVSGIELVVTNSGVNITASVGESAHHKLDLTGGPLTDTYEFLQCHAHWADRDDCGSEHTLNGKAFAAEIHFVHWNKSRYGSPAEAVANDNGLCVLGVWVDVSSDSDDLTPLDDLLKAYQHVSYKNDSPYEVKESINPYSLLPENKHEYFTYAGSLTTPPCSECVTWIVFKHPINVSKKQMEKLRSFKACSHQEEDKNDLHDPFAKNAEEEACPSAPHIRNNFRPVQELHGRVIRCSF